MKNPEPGSQEPDLPETEVEEEAEWEWDPTREDTIRAKWLMDGCTTLSEAAAALRNEAERLLELEAAGWRLQGPIDFDYGWIYLDDDVAINAPVGSTGLETKGAG